MNKEQLLEKAIKDYPEGTVHTGYATRSKYTVLGKLHWSCNNIYSNNAGCIYHGASGIWATIISKPEPEFVLPVNWYVIVTEENQNILSKWRYENNYNFLKIGYIVGMTKNGDGSIVEKGHNPIENIRCSPSRCSYDFGNEITFEQFEKYVLKKDTNPNDVVTAVTDKYYSITQIETQLLKDYDKEDVKDIIKSIKATK